MRRRGWQFILIFLLGMVADRAFISWRENSHKNSRQNSERLLASRQGVDVQAAAGLNATESAALLNQKNLVSADSSLQSGAVAATAAASPTPQPPLMAAKNPTSLYASADEKWLDKAAEEELWGFISGGIPKGLNAAPWPQDDGSLVVHEEANDGGIITRSYRKDGAIEAESWQRADGGLINRNFFRDGSLRSVYWKRDEKASTYLNFTERGRIRGRTEEFADGSKLSAEYDENGDLLDKWQIDKEGRGTKVE